MNNCIIALRKLEKEFHEEKRFHLHKNADAMYFPIFHLIGPLEEYLTEHDNFQEREENEPYNIIFQEYYYPAHDLESMVFLSCLNNIYQDPESSYFHPDNRSVLPNDKYVHFQLSYYFFL